MKNYFKECNSAQEAKELFRKLCFTLHPDKGGDAEEFKIMLNDFQNFVPGDEKEKESFAKYSGHFAELIQKLCFIPEVEVSIVGCWVWVEGNTKPYKDQIKAACGDEYKCNWNRTRSLWQIKPASFVFRKYTNKEYKKEDLQKKYGGNDMKKQERKMIA